MDKKGVMVEEWKARRKEWKKKRWKKGKREKVVLGKVLFVFSVSKFESFCQLPGSVLSTHSLWESGGLLHYCLWPMAVEVMQLGGMKRERLERRKTWR